MINQFLFKRLLTACYCSARLVVHKKKGDRVIPFTLHIFLTSFMLIAFGLYTVILGLIEFKFKSFLPTFIGLAVIGFGIDYLFREKTKKAISRWHIEKKYKTLTKNERFNKYILTFIFFWGSFALFFYLSVKFTEGYLLN